MPTLLIVSASPLDQDRLRLSAEVRDIREALRRSRNRENWTIESNEAVTVDGLRRALLDCRPTVVHFSGHGGGADGLCFEDADGGTNLADAAPLAKLFHLFRETLKCVVLNACYSDVQGEVIQREVDYVVGMRAAVDDNSAAKFAVAFYDAVFAGTSFRAAFDLGCTALNLNKLADADVPVFMTGAHLNPSVLTYSALVPEIESLLFAYFNSPFGERAKFTTSGDTISEKIQQFYGERMHRTVGKVRVLGMKQINDSHWRVQVSNSEAQLMYIRVQERSALVEWEASVGLWSVPLKTYLALGSKEPVVARVHAELATYYNHDFQGQEHQFQCVELSTQDSGRLYGYVHRRSPTYPALMGILSDGNSHAITLEIVDAVDRTETSVITKLLSPTWIYPALDTDELRSVQPQT